MLKSCSECFFNVFKCSFVQNLIFRRLRMGQEGKYKWYFRKLILLPASTNMIIQKNTFFCEKELLNTLSYVKKKVDRKCAEMKLISIINMSLGVELFYKTLPFYCACRYHNYFGLHKKVTILFGNL